VTQSSRQRSGVYETPLRLRLVYILTTGQSCVATHSRAMNSVTDYVT